MTCRRFIYDHTLQKKKKKKESSSLKKVNVLERLIQIHNLWIESVLPTVLM